MMSLNVNRRDVSLHLGGRVGSSNLWFTGGGYQVPMQLCRSERTTAPTQTVPAQPMLPRPNDCPVGDDVHAVAAEMRREVDRNV